MRLSRRGLLGGVGLAAVATGCSGDPDPAVPTADDPPPSDPTPVPGSDVLTPTRVSYGDDESQYADLYRPAPVTTGGQANGQAKGVVVVIHGGFWRADYDATLGAPLALSLAENGWAAWNLEYRRVDGGGGWPATFDDVAAGIDALAEHTSEAERACVLTLGHSAGGHLATWAAARGRYDWPERVAVTGVVSQAGVLDLAAALDNPTARAHVVALMGDDDPTSEAYRRADPTQQVPLDVPVRCVHGRGDTIVPISQSRSYVGAATEAGADAALVEVDGDHFTVIETADPAWATILEELEALRHATQ